jgi:hypothetical protein
MFIKIKIRKQMKKIILFLLTLSIFSCQSVKINGRNYKYSSSTTELGSVGQSKTVFVKNLFYTHAFPKLENKIRVDVKFVPFKKKTFKIYNQKLSPDQQPQVQFMDSLKIKPTFVTIDILDISGYINEVNSPTNKEAVNYLKNSNKTKIVTSISVMLSIENSAKIKQADAYYLTNSQDNKYQITLYKSNKKVEVLDIASNTIFAYELSKCCWVLDDKANWTLADIIKENTSCTGNTSQKVTKNQETKNLFKM